MKKSFQASIVFLLVLSLCSCFTIRMVNIHPEWNPEKGQEWADAQCKARARTASGYDWIDASSNRNEAYSACMASYGYELRKFYNEQDAKATKQ